MAFGDSVAALLDTYSNCLSLLKAFKHHEGKSELDFDKQQGHLRKSLKSDRASVERVYFTRLSEAGSRLEKGDGKIPSSYPMSFILPLRLYANA